MTDSIVRNHVSNTSKKPLKGAWNAALFIIFVEVAERFAFFGLAGNLMTYLTEVLRESAADAAKSVSIWIGASFLLPLVGAFLSDSYFGCFKMIAGASVVYFIGTIMLVLSTTSLVPTHYRGPTMFIALYVLAIGEGGHKPCVTTFAADQFDDKNPTERLAKSSFFNWWFLCSSFGGVIAIPLIILVQQYIGWGGGFGVISAAMFIAVVIFLLGYKRYRKKSPEGSPFTKLCQVVVSAARKWRLNETHDSYGVCYDDEDDNEDQCHGSPSHPRTNQLRFLDKATMIDKIDKSNHTRNPWRLCTVNEAEDAKLVLRLIPIWVTGLMFVVNLNQIHFFYTKQAETLQRSLGPKFVIPAPSLQSLAGPITLISIPIYDLLFVPFARKFTGHPAGITMLQRVGVGLFLSIVNMVAAALVEIKRVGVARDHGLTYHPETVLPMSVWWLLPQYVINGVSSGFFSVGLQELFYDQMPDTMRSLGAGAFISVTGIASFVNSLIISCVQTISAKYGDIWLVDNVNLAHLDGFYWILAGLGGVNFFVYLWFASRFVYKEKSN